MASRRSGDVMTWWVMHVVGGLDFESWYRREHPRLLASIVLVSGQPDLAREAVDEALVRALERWDRVSAMASPGGRSADRRVGNTCVRSCRVAGSPYHSKNKN